MTLTYFCFPFLSPLFARLAAARHFTAAERKSQGRSDPEPLDVMTIIPLANK